MGEVALEQNYRYALCRVDSGAWLHDGFFARSEVGISWLEATVSNSGQLHRRSRISAIGESSSVDIGATPARGLVLGISVWTAILDPTFVEDGKTVIPDDDSVKLTLLRLGPFVDWYPNPKRGYHVLGGAGFSVQIERDTKGKPIYPIPLGFSLSTGTGYEWFVSSELSVGFLGRFAFGWLTRMLADAPERMLFVTPELAVTVTYH
jgi:hypothetical protein